MRIDVTEITAKSALVRSRIPRVNYVINPYLGCGHGCRYCYATFMRKYSRHHAQAAWGSFVEVKVNIAQVLAEELRRKRQRGTALLSSVCDPYQPVERRYGLTRRCLEILREAGWSIDILTRSPLVLRDLDLLAAAAAAPISVGLSIPTDDDRIRQVVEPNAPPIGARLETLKKLHGAGIPTWVFVAPMLPLKARNLAAAIAPYADYVMLDPLNYRSQVRSLFHRQQWDYALTDRYAHDTALELTRLLGSKVVRA
jgi:DNA repair photolyase